VLELSQCFRTVVFYVLSSAAETCDNATHYYR
jgi:hypothetical protein